MGIANLQQFIVAQRLLQPLNLSRIREQRFDHRTLGLVGKRFDQFREINLGRRAAAGHAVPSWH